MPYQLGTVLAYPAVSLAQILNSTTCVQYRGMVPAAECIADFRQAVVREFLRQRHRHLARPRYRSAAPLRKQVGNANLEILGHGFLDVLDRDEPRLHRQQIALLARWRREKQHDAEAAEATQIELMLTINALAAAPDLDALWADLIEIYRAEVRELWELGCRYVQFDDVTFAIICDPKFRAAIAQPRVG